MKKYMLKNGKPIICNNLLEWASWFERLENRKIAETTIEGIRVSTVFLGLDHNYFEEGLPILWETMIFGGGEEIDEYQVRYASQEEAEAGHQAAVLLVEATLKKRKFKLED